MALEELTVISLERLAEFLAECKNIFATSDQGRKADTAVQPADIADFVTRTVDDLANYYLKSETYTKDEVAALIGTIQQFHYEIYPTLADVVDPVTNVLYLIGPIGTGSDMYEEYIYPDNITGWVKIGDTSIDLSGYVTTTNLNTILENYVTVADLNTVLSNYTNTSDLNLLLATKQDIIPDLDTIRSGSVLGETAYQKPVGGIPKEDLTSGVQTSLEKADTAVQPEAGKGLFSGNYNDLSNKPTIPAAQVQSDWDEIDTDSKAYIQNKPTIPTVPTISTDIEADKTDNTKTASPKAVYDAMSEDEEVTAAALCELEEKKLDKDKLVDTYNSYVANAHEKAASAYALYDFYRQIVTDEEILATALNNLNTLGILASAIAPLYKAGTRTFAVDDCCIYESQFYRCTTAVTSPEPFDPTKWERTNAYTVIMSRIKTMTGATASAAGSAGYAPAPAAGDEGKFLRGDGTWQNVSVPQEIMNLIYAGL